MREALYYEKEQKGWVRCNLCPHHCHIGPGKVGICRVRKNIEGKLYSLNYGKVSSIALDPIEKKPLYHFHPGKPILSVGSFGCNFRCQFCQNWQIAQLTEVPAREITPEQLVDIAQKQSYNIGIAYTYNEPSIWYEYVLECCKLAKKRGLKNVLVTNGFIESEPLEELLPYVDAMNIDVKGYTQDFYKDLVFGNLAAVKNTVERAQKSCHIEITTLLIPGRNDKEEEVRALAEWLSSLSRDIPLHFSCYFPNYKLDLPPTPVETLKKARGLAKLYLNYVYIGNVIDEEGNSTYCPKCGEVLIRRSAYRIQKCYLKGRCENCKSPISIVE